MASILPNQIPPESVDFISANDPKKMAHNWWLWCYNISQAVLGNTGTTAAAFAAQANAELDADVYVTDSIGLMNRVAALEQRIDDQYPVVTEIRFADELSEPVNRAQPAQVITPGASPFTYTALSDGVLIVNGGTVSAVAVSRDGVTFYTTSVGSIPLSRLDKLKTTYTGTPTMTFFPR